MNIHSFTFISSILESFKDTFLTILKNSILCKQKGFIEILRKDFIDYRDFARTATSFSLSVSHRVVRPRAVQYCRYRPMRYPMGSAISHCYCTNNKVRNIYASIVLGKMSCLRAIVRSKFPRL